MNEKDFSVYIKIQNDTDDTLEYPSHTAEWGEWVLSTIPNVIPPRKSAEGIRLIDHAGPSGSEGRLSYLVRREGDLFSRISTYETCPWGYDNKVTVSAIEPPALYDIYWRAKSGGHGWQDFSVPRPGHPVWVELTVKYTKKQYRFRLIRIEASSDHPLVNTEGKIIIGKHVLWRPGDVSPKGSLQPNAFGYKFGSSVPAASRMTVTIKILDIELLWCEAMLYGTVNGDRVMQSGFFVIKTTQEIPLQVNVTRPNTSAKPFGWNANVVWGMELRQSKNPVVCVHPDTTRLELYWISETLHPALKAGVPVEFLRSVVPEIPIRRFKDLSNLTPWFDFVATVAFGAMQKEYDTNTGAARFGVYIDGGTFQLTRYCSTADDDRRPGSRYRVVNCMDQAAYVELCCSLLHRPSWLLQKPFGFINTTYLVGVNVPCNNPFFGTNHERAMVGINDLDRTQFCCHVYTGDSYHFDRDRDGIYDACGGPHRGDEDPSQYLASSIDSVTNLYQIKGVPRGTVADIAQGEGVTGINAAAILVPKVFPAREGEHDDADIENIIQDLQNLEVTPADARPYTQSGWMRLLSWVRNALGRRCEITDRFVHVGRGTAHAHWDLRHADPGDLEITVDVYAETRENLNSDGQFDRWQSAEAIKDRLTKLLTSFDRDPQQLFTRCMVFDDEGHVCMEYRRDLEAGRFIVLSNNFIVDISGAPSTAALEPAARRLFQYAYHRRDMNVGPRVPMIQEVLFKSPDDPEEFPIDGHVDVPGGIGVVSTVRFELDAPIAAAAASIEGEGVLVTRTEINTEGGRSSVEFDFYSRKVGMEVMEAHFAHASTLTVGTFAYVVLNVMD